MKKEEIKNTLWAQELNEEYIIQSS